VIAKYERAVAEEIISDLRLALAHIPLTQRAADMLDAAVIYIDALERSGSHLHRELEDLKRQHPSRYIVTP
jgi:hypothetical protein